MSTGCRHKRTSQYRDIGKLLIMKAYVSVSEERQGRRLVTEPNNAAQPDKWDGRRFRSPVRWLMLRSKAARNVAFVGLLRHYIATISSPIITRERISIVAANDVLLWFVIALTVC